MIWNMNPSSNFDIKRKKMRSKIKILVEYPSNAFKINFSLTFSSTLNWDCSLDLADHGLKSGGKSVGKSILWIIFLQ